MIIEPDIMTLIALVVHSFTFIENISFRSPNKPNESLFSKYKKSLNTLVYYLFNSQKYNLKLCSKK